MAIVLVASGPVFLLVSGAVSLIELLFPAPRCPFRGKLRYIIYPLVRTVQYVRDSKFWEIWSFKDTYGSTFARNIMLVLFPLQSRVLVAAGGLQ